MSVDSTSLSPLEVHLQTLTIPNISEFCGICHIWNSALFNQEVVIIIYQQKEWSLYQCLSNAILYPPPAQKANNLCFLSLNQILHAATIHFILSISTSLLCGIRCLLGVLYQPHYPYQPSATSSRESIKFDKHNLPLTKSCWLSLI